MKIKTVYIVSIEDDEAGEAEGMFSEDGKLLGTWHGNDGQWRDEYFNGFMKELGIEVKRSQRKDLKDRLIYVHTIGPYV